jgi:hypothetical protein
MADAQDLKFHFWRFQGVSSRFTNDAKTIYFIGENAIPAVRIWLL